MCRLRWNIVVIGVVIVITLLYTTPHRPIIVHISYGQQDDDGTPQTSSRVKTVNSSNEDTRQIDAMTGCSVQHRLSTIEQYCTEQKVAARFMYKYRRQQKLLQYQQQRRRGLVDVSNSNSNTAVDWLDELPDEDILNISRELWIDPANELVICLHSKAGSTTWKAILGNNSMLRDYQVASEPSTIHRDIYIRGVRTADNGNNIDEIKHRLRTWYKIAVVRHPFDRLVSSFNDKVLTENPLLPSANFSRALRETIRSRYQPKSSINHQSTSERTQFKDFMQLILDGYSNDHWNGPYEDKCHACLLRYDYIVKLETQARDAQHIIKHKLRGRGLDTHFNQRRHSPGTVLAGRDLAPYFHTLSQQQYNKLAEKYASDFHMYGYHMDDRTFVAKCADRSSNNTCC